MLIFSDIFTKFILKLEARAERQSKNVRKGEIVSLFLFVAVPIPGTGGWAGALVASILGIDVVVTDHHKPREILPDAVAVVDPHREDCEGEYKDLAGVGVAFKLVCALESDNGWGVMEQYADLICIGTVADIVPLTGENRILVRQGLSIMSETANRGLRVLLEETGLAEKKLTADMVAFGSAPPIR